MADTQRRPRALLSFLAGLAEAPHRHGFFASLRRLEALRDGSPQLGASSSARDDALRLGQVPSNAFAPSTLTDFESASPKRPARLRVAFFGLFGPQGPLPGHLTEYVRDRVRQHRDRTFEAFSDVFHHRLLSLFYRAWANAEPTVHLDRGGGDTDRFAGWLGALFGRSPAQPSADEDACLPFAGRLAAQVRNAEGLEAMVGAQFAVPARLEPMVGGWLDLPGEERLRLGGAPVAGLGEGAVLGARCWSRQHHFRLVLGPMSLDAYRALLPGGRHAAKLARLVRTYAGEEHEFDVRLVLAGAALPAPVLGSAPTLGAGPALGWSAWLGGDATDRGDLRLGEPKLVRTPARAPASADAATRARAA